jgi:CheY-like chemotaxis protein
MPSPKIKLLIVDDEPTTRTLMSQIFIGLGHNVRAAEDGFAALTEIRQDVPDLILSDLNMPGMSGFELLSVVRRRFPGIQVIAMSGAFSGDHVQPGVAADAFYEKASSLSSLMRIVESITNPNGSTLQKTRSLAPFWIQHNGHTASGEAYVTISCPECLRTFPQVSGEAVGNIHIHEATCIYCSSKIHFAIVQPTDPASPQAFQRKPINVIPLPLKLPSAVY